MQRTKPRVRFKTRNLDARTCFSDCVNEQYTSTLDEQRINPCKRLALRFHEITYCKRTKELTSVMYLLAAEIEFITNIL